MVSLPQFFKKIIFYLHSDNTEVYVHTYACKYDSNKKGTLRTNDLAVCGKQQPKSFGVDHENHSTLALIHDKTATLRASNTFLLTYGIELREN